MMQLQYVVLTTEGLYFWGTEDPIIHSNVKSGNAFGKVTNIHYWRKWSKPIQFTYGCRTFRCENAGTTHSLALATCIGDVWVLSMDHKKYGDGTQNDDIAKSLLA